MIKSVPRRTYVLFVLVAITGLCALTLLQSFPKDAHLSITRPLSNSDAPTTDASPESPQAVPSSQPEVVKAPSTDAPASGPSSPAAPAPEAPKPQTEAPKPPPERKYFYEAGGSMGLIHYDKRYFVQAVSYEEHIHVLRNLVRSYMAMTREHGIETWIAHGTLLGWWWNTRIMPWDYDLDVQMNDTTLALLGEKHNMTRWRFELDSFRINELFDNVPSEATADIADAELVRLQEIREESGDKKEGDAHDFPGRWTDYLMDVNPNSAQRIRGAGRNVIDARWIDTTNGMFIDITGLSENDPEGKPGVVSCKNNHYYPTHWLFPLKKAEFEGVQVMVPNKPETVLADEYGEKSMTVTEFHDHKWDPKSREWMKKGWFKE